MGHFHPWESVWLLLLPILASNQKTPAKTTPAPAGATDAILWYCSVLSLIQKRVVHTVKKDCCPAYKNCKNQIVFPYGHDLFGRRKKNHWPILSTCVKEIIRLIKRGSEMTENRQTKQMADLINLAMDQMGVAVTIRPNYQSRDDQAGFSVKSDLDKHL